MHNKLMVADYAAAIVGGRNIGDIYYGVDAIANYRDLDVLAAGPVVRDLSGSLIAPSEPILVWRVLSRSAAPPSPRSSGQDDLTEREALGCRYRRGRRIAEPR